MVSVSVKKADCVDADETARYDFEPVSSGSTCTLCAQYLFWSVRLKGVSVKYSKTSMTRTPMARLPWLIRTRFWSLEKSSESH